MAKNNLNYLSNCNLSIHLKLLCLIWDNEADNKILVWIKMDRAINNRPKDPTLCGRAQCFKPRI